MFLFSMGLGVLFFLTATVFDRVKSVPDFLRGGVTTVTKVWGMLLIVGGAYAHLDRFGYLAKFFGG